MLNQKEILSTIEMIDQQHLDIRTITMGISLLSCCDPDPKRACEKIYDKITRYAEKLVKTGEDIEREFGIPIVNKRISVTPMALVAGASETEDCVPLCPGPGPGGPDLRRQLYRRLLRPGAEGHDRGGREADPLHSGGSGPDRTGLFLRQRGVHPGGHQHGRGGPDGPHRQRIPLPPRRTGMASAAPSWWCSAMPWRTTPLWPALSTAWERRRRSSTWASPAPAWCVLP